jgi:hypothetical protein
VPEAVQAVPEKGGFGAGFVAQLATDAAHASADAVRGAAGHDACEAGEPASDEGGGVMREVGVRLKAAVDEALNLAVA